MHTLPLLIGVGSNLKTGVAKTFLAIVLELEMEFQIPPATGCFLRGFGYVPGPVPLCRFFFPVISV